MSRILVGASGLASYGMLTGAIVAALAGFDASTVDALSRGGLTGAILTAIGALVFLAPGTGDTRDEEDPR